MTKIKIVESETNNYCVYDGQCQAQDAYIYICPEYNKMYSDYDSNIGSGMSGYIWHKRELRFGIPASLTTYTINQIMEEITDKAQRIVDGYECEWNGSNHVGVYSDDAQDAIDELETYFERCEYDVESLCIFESFEDLYYDEAEFLAEAEAKTFNALLDEIKDEIYNVETLIEFDAENIVDHLVDEIENERMTRKDFPQWCIDDSEKIREALKEQE